MRVFTAMVFCCICVSLTSCSDKPATTCVGGSKTGMSAERMSDLDKYFINTDFKKYVGLSLGDLERDFAIKYKERTAITKPPAKLVGVTYSFPGNYSFYVYFSDVKFTTYDEKKKKWDFSKIKNEKISGIKIEHLGVGDFYYCKDYWE